MIQREQRAALIARANCPRPLPADAVDSVRVIAEIARELLLAPLECEARNCNAVRIGNERIARMQAYIARPRRRRAQDVDVTEAE